MTSHWLCNAMWILLPLFVIRTWAKCGAASTSAAMVAACGPSNHGYEKRIIKCEGPLNAERQKNSSLMVWGKRIFTASKSLCNHDENEPLHFR